MQKNKQIISRFLTVYIVVGLIIVGWTLAVLIRQEVKTSKLQAKYLSEISKQLGYKLVPGATTSVRYPEYGPYDQRLGYTELPSEIARLKKLGYGITAQAAFSPKMTELADEFGLFTIYHEKAQAGLRILDRRNEVIFNALFPAHGYANFDAIPPIILNTLLFIENRELLNEENATVNPAIEWDRFGYAGLKMIAHKLGAGGNVAGGSTLATQIEKYRHSPSGYTNSITDKLRQMGTASIRAYLLGPDTRAMRQEIALSYLNTMPLAATPKAGEVHGLGDGLSAWFGADFEDVNSLLSPKALTATTPISRQQAQAYRQVLSVLLSQRRPSYLLGRGFNGLQTLADSYLRLMSDQGVISKQLRDAALKEKTTRLQPANQMPSKFAVEKKTQTVMRTRLAKTLGVKSNYELDRFDLTVKTTLDFNTQKAVTKELRRLSEPENARAAGILGFRMLNENTSLTPIVYSLMLFERGSTGNLLRVQTDNYDQALDINEGIRIDLGSTAKLRTMVHYLELITEIYQQYQGRPQAELSQIQLHPRDFLSAWVLDQLRVNPTIMLEDLLNQALDKRYSASPGESFFTGGGIHTFSNFTKDENGKIMSVRHALRDSVNLVFIRLMRDLVYHHLYKPDGLARWLENPDDTKRKEYLQRFADREGSVYLNRFYAKYHDKSANENLAALTQRVLVKPSRLAMLYRAIYPEHDETQLNQFLQAHVSKTDLAKEDLYELYDKYSVERFDLQDQGYITKIHPLELWLVSYLAQHPEASREEILEASSKERQDVYRWLFKGRRKNSQNRRIMTLLEAEAFKKIHQAWQRVGYPFEALTPSYATAIGASGDRPLALAELVGIIQNNGVRLPVVRFDSLHFAAQTPYEALLNKLPEQGARIFAPEIAKVARGALSGVVEGGTASRLNNVYTNAQGQPLSVGGKTGTGDHRKEVWGPGGRLLESKFISRAAVFTFFIGERFFGVITAYVTGEDAGNYHFTSSLPVQILKSLKSTLTPMLNAAPSDEGVKGLPAKTVVVNKPKAGAAQVTTPILSKTAKPLAKSTPVKPKADVPALTKTIKPLPNAAPIKPKTDTPTLTKTIKPLPNATSIKPKTDTPTLTKTVKPLPKSTTSVKPKTDAPALTNTVKPLPKTTSAKPKTDAMTTTNTVKPQPKTAPAKPKNDATTTTVKQLPKPTAPKPKANSVPSGQGPGYLTVKKLSQLQSSKPASNKPTAPAAKPIPDTVTKPATPSATGQ